MGLGLKGWGFWEALLFVFAVMVWVHRNGVSSSYGSYKSGLGFVGCGGGWVVFGC